MGLQDPGGWRLVGNVGGGLGLRTVVVPRALWTASLGAFLGSRAPTGLQGCVHGGGVWPHLAAEPGTVVVPVSG
jgi:hypothetical protein